MSENLTYEELLSEIKQLRKENALLRNTIVSLGGRIDIPIYNKTEVDSADFNALNNVSESVAKRTLIVMSLDEKIALFRSLFKGREDVFARRWYSAKSGNSGYQPVCQNEWRYGLCDKKMVKCADCPNRDFKVLEYRDVYEHLDMQKAREDSVIGLYPIMQDNSCWLLCADFDDKSCEHGYKEDVLAYVKVAEEWNVPCFIERSRSGKGAHVWIFFEESVEAKQARKLGNALLSEAMQRRGQMTLNSYDRLFPNQDILTDGGFGNLVALPLQGLARKKENSVFVDKDFRVIDDQWAYLAEVKRVSRSLVETLLREHVALTSMGEFTKSSENVPWEVPTAPVIATDDFAKKVVIVRANMLYIALNSLSAKVVNHLKRIAAFKNPDFYAKRAMHLSTYNVPRIISCSMVDDEYIGLPRGCEDALVDFLDENNVEYEFEDKTNNGHSIAVSFKGELREDQQEAVCCLTANNNGILHATTAFGKTVAAIGLIAKRKTNTLIIVHTKALLDQWKSRLEEFLLIDYVEDDAPKKRSRKKAFSPFGTLDSTGNSLHGQVDIALFQSCLDDSEMGVKPFVCEYGMVIVDECHHVPASNFEVVLRRLFARYVYGLTATPTRKDGHQPIIFMQCGPIRYVADAKRQMETQNFSRVLKPRFTSFRMMNNETWSFTQLCDKLVQDNTRNQLIVDDAIEAVKEGRTPLILSSRTEHVQLLCDMLSLNASFVTVIGLVGSEKAKEKRKKMKSLEALPASSPLVIVAIDKYVGEGFDYPRLDTLLLTMPFSQKNLVAQYTGRLHRNYEGKTDVRVLDYVDIRIPLADKMYRKRLRGYSAVGYNRPSAGGQQVVEQQCIYSADEFWSVYVEDVKTSAARSLVIVSPKIWLPSFAPMLELIAEKQAEGVEVVVFTSSDNNHTERLHSKGIHTQVNAAANIPCVIIDKNIVWYGSVNFLAKTNSEEHVIRMKDANLAEQLIAVAVDERGHKFEKRN